jgi:hypothetical protein
VPQTHCNPHQAPSAVTMLSYDIQWYKVLDTANLGQDVGRNVCHGSDAVVSAKKEIALWFGKDEVIEYKQAQHDWIYEK